MASSEEGGATVGGLQQEMTGGDLCAGVGFQVQTSLDAELLEGKMCSPWLAQDMSLNYQEHLKDGCDKFIRAPNL